MKRIVLVVTLVSLAAVTAASAGGWATVRLSSTPDGKRAGQPWIVRLTVLRHGVTPLAGVEPVVLIQKGGVRLRYAARPTGTTGVYRARVVFPAAGTWSWKVDDGFSRIHDYYPVEIGAREAA